jgi:ribosomal protein S18 acetylase RimI-like enzyme
MARRVRLPSILVRERTSADDYFLSDLADDAFGDWSPDPARSVFAMLASSRARCFVAELGGDAVGFAVVEIEPLKKPFGPWRAPKVARLDAIAVSIEARRAGVARKLLAEAESFALREGAVVMRLRTAASNRAAQNLFTKNGYAAICRVMRGYANGDTAIEMFRSFG